MISLNSKIKIILQDPLKICKKVSSLNLSTECVQEIFNYGIENNNMDGLKVSLFPG